MDSLHTTMYSEVSGVPTYAVRRVSDGHFMNDDGNFVPLESYGSLNIDAIDRRTSPNHWAKNGFSLEGCEVVAIAVATVVTAVPVK